MFLNHLVGFPAVSVYLSLADALFVQIILYLPLVIMGFKWCYFALWQVVYFLVNRHPDVECRAEPAEFDFGVHLLVGL